MFNRASVRLAAIAVLLFVIGVSGTAAGQQAVTATAPVLDQAAIQRSRAVQAELARIEANKEAFIDELFGRWAPYLDPTAYDLWGSLKPIAMAATPWRLLGASLTSDFESGVRVLRGVVGPGWYVSAYIEGREPVVGSGTTKAPVSTSGVGTTAMGDAQWALVFTPIAPCRVVDTRGIGAAGPGLRTGIMAAGSTRVFDLSAAGLSEGQGGDTSCAALPTFQNKAWAVNITVFGYSELGHLTVWPYTFDKPTTSFMNFSPTAYAMANSGTVTGCYGCSNSINVSVAAATHVIIDVMGYYEEATGFAGGAVSNLVGTATGIGPGDSGVALGGACPADTVIIGGSVETTATAGTMRLGDQSVSSGTTWRQVVTNTHASSTFSATSTSRCMDVK